MNSEPKHQEYDAPVVTGLIGGAILGGLTGLAVAQRAAQREALDEWLRLNHEKHIVARPQGQLNRMVAIEEAQKKITTEGNPKKIWGVVLGAVLGGVAGVIGGSMMSKRGEDV